MKIKVLVALTCLCCHQMAIAALPPTAESLRRMKAVLESNEVYEKLGAVNWVKSVSEIGEEYILQTEKCTLHLKVEVVPPAAQEPALIGPLPLKVIIGDYSCR